MGGRWYNGMTGAEDRLRDRAEAVQDRLEEIKATATAREGDEKDVFSEDERGYCVLLLETVPPELSHQARLGEENCPEQAISLEED